jgi:hypothetical protein
LALSIYCFINHKKIIPYHTECVAYPKDHFKAITKNLGKNGNVPNLAKGGGGGRGTPKLFPALSREGFPNGQGRTTNESVIGYQWFIKRED